MSEESTPAGWYDDGQGGQRWWDGTTWGEAAPAAAPAVTTAYCSNCATQIDAQTAICPSCGFPAAAASNYCRACGNATQPGQAVCMSCGTSMASWRPAEKDKLTAGLLAIFLGGFGVHKFYLGYTTAGVLQIFLTILTCGIGTLVPLVEGIIYLTKSDEEFKRIYTYGERQWF